MEHNRQQDERTWQAWIQSDEAHDKFSGARRVKVIELGSLVLALSVRLCFFFFQAEDGIRDRTVTGVQTCALPIWPKRVPGGAIEEPTRARCDEPAPPELIRGIAQFNAGEFFEQHETLELLWRDTRTPVRGLYHGILQVGVGFHHWRNGNFHGASTLLEEGIDRLRPFAPRCHGVEVDELIADATAARERLIALGAEGMRRVDIAWMAPRIRFTG